MNLIAEATTRTDYTKRNKPGFYLSLQWKGMAFDIVNADEPASET